MANSNVSLSVITSYPRCNNKAGSAPRRNVIFNGLSAGWTQSVPLAAPAGGAIRAAIKSGGFNSRDVHIVKGRNVFSFLSSARTLCPAVAPAPGPRGRCSCPRGRPPWSAEMPSSRPRGLRGQRLSQLHQKPTDLCVQRERISPRGKIHF